ncbi:MAG TPA: hypothetical protein VLC10_03275 [Patescibacteria group bacterium]|nr:hypothetical protein [Patescibacteria group bacterium]
MKKRLVMLISAGVVAAAGVAWYFLSDAYCSRFDYTVSWAWSTPDSAEKKEQRCEEAGCRAVEAGSYDDPQSIDEEYTAYRCVRR